MCVPGIFLFYYMMEGVPTISLSEVLRHIVRQVYPPSPQLYGGTGILSPRCRGTRKVITMRFLTYNDKGVLIDVIILRTGQLKKIITFGRILSHLSKRCKILQNTLKDNEAAPENIVRTQRCVQLLSDQDLVTCPVTIQYRTSSFHLIYCCFR